MCIMNFTALDVEQADFILLLAVLVHSYISYTVSKCVVAEFPVTIMCLYKVRKTACSQLCVDALSSISKRVFIEFILLKEECLLNK